ncbi:MAG: MBOAT family O-acyltransferase, partial [Oscillospiraceae bacterium]
MAIAVSLILNLGLLIIFKYSGFITQNINMLLNTNFAVSKFALPIGISFYTFQTISYTIDVYRGKTAVQHSFLNFLMYVSLYFQLVAGPIVRYSDIADQIENRHEKIENVSNGLNRFCIGLTKKVIIANVAGKLSEPYLGGDFANLSIMGAWFGAILFTIQIYYDFSGYSDMAIGLGNMFGFKFNENFNFPYISKTATEFWRRWHISLGSFFRDYVYIPLGGNRKNMYLNLFIVWFLTGLWHGASWNFVIWGMFYGGLITIEKIIGKNRIEKIPSVFLHGYLLLAVVIGWVIF